jgi:hypothetical protein
MIINPLEHSDYQELLTQLNKLDYCIELKSSESKALGYNFKDGKVWKIQTEILINGNLKEIKLFINFSIDFPYTVPKIFIDKEFYNEVKFIPHIDSNFIICILDSNLTNTFYLEKPISILEYLINSAKNIIEQGINDKAYCFEEYNREFKSYWNQSYAKNDNPFVCGLHDINISLKEPQILRGIKFNNSLKNYNFFISDKTESLQSLVKSLKLNENDYCDIDVIFIKKSFSPPPYHLSVKQAIELIRENQNRYPEFKKVINKNSWDKILVVFAVDYNSNTEYYGWSYGNINVPQNGGFNRKSKIQLMTESHCVGENNLVVRISFENIHIDRLQKRTSGYVEIQKSVAMSGLGSVGSNLIYFLKNLPVNKFHLIDNDYLTIDNIKRHLLGFIDTNINKSERIANFLKESDLSLSTDFRNDSISNVILKEANFINDCDFHIVAIGDSSIESFILTYIQNKVLTKPTIFFWVEPYLASGQMLYILPNDSMKALDLIRNYPYHVINSENNKNNNLYLIEGGCQTGYFPYSSTYLIQFLSCVFPKLKDIILQGSEESKIFSWVGEKEFLIKKDISISEFGNKFNSYTLVESIL